MLQVRVLRNRTELDIKSIDSILCHRRKQTKIDVSFRCCWLPNLFYTEAEKHMVEFLPHCALVRVHS